MGTRLALTVTLCVGTLCLVSCARNVFPRAGEATDAAPGDLSLVDGGVAAGELRIITATSTESLQAGVLELNQSLEMRAALFDAKGGYVALVPVRWSVISAQFGTADLTPEVGPSEKVVFLPRVAGVAVFQAELPQGQGGRDASALAGPITVVSPLIGSSASMRFDTQPAGDVARVPFATQPVVSLRDATGELIPATADVVLTLQRGDGNLTGTLKAALVAGTASFVDVGYDSAEADVVVRASAAGLSVDSNPLTFRRAPEGACQKNDKAFVTAEGGCKDQATGLVWSASSATADGASAAMWDSKRNGSLPPDAQDHGRTNDADPAQPGGVCPTVCDASAKAYCHELIEGGRTDWRLPSADELATLARNMTAAGGGKRIAGQVAGSYWSSTAQEADHLRTVQLDTGVTESVSIAGESRHLLCVRGGWTSDASVTLVSKPSIVGVNAPPIRPLVVRLRDSAGYRVFAQGVTITLSSAKPLAGTLSASTDASGTAVLDAWQVKEQGKATLTISSATLPAMNQAPASATVHVEVGPFPHSCAKETAELWLSADGGCKQVTSKLVWSAPGGVMDWGHYIWDSEHPSTAPDPQPSRRQPDVDDGGRVFDYDTARPNGGGYDSSLVDYCHDLIQGGFGDWRAAKLAELQQAQQDDAVAHWGARANRVFLSATTRDYRRSNMWLINVETGELREEQKGYRAVAICVRQSN